MGGGRKLFALTIAEAVVVSEALSGGVVALALVEFSRVMVQF
jgi:hypothetical protein